MVVWGQFFLHLLRLPCSEQWMQAQTQRLFISEKSRPPTPLRLVPFRFPVRLKSLYLPRTLLTIKILSFFQRQPRNSRLLEHVCHGCRPCRLGDRRCPPHIPLRLPNRSHCDALQGEHRRISLDVHLRRSKERLRVHQRLRAISHGSTFSLHTHHTCATIIPPLPLQHTTNPKSYPSSPTESLQLRYSSAYTRRRQAQTLFFSFPLPTVDVLPKYKAALDKVGYYDWELTVARQPVKRRISSPDLDLFAALDPSLVWDQFPPNTHVLSMHGIADEVVPV
jgi:hypothetical protein